MSVFCVCCEFRGLFFADRVYGFDPQCPFEEFMELVRQYSKQERNVRFYARRLNITPKYLSTVSKDVSGKTAARWIDEAVILEAKSLLRYSGMSIQEIAYHLNFSTQSFFGKYFKQHTGYSPSRFKRKGS